MGNELRQIHCFDFHQSLFTTMLNVIDILGSETKTESDVDFILIHSFRVTEEVSKQPPKGKKPHGNQFFEFFPCRYSLLQKNKNIAKILDQLFVFLY